MRCKKIDPLVTIGEGRCSTAAPMLALGRLPSAHMNPWHRANIDAERIPLGQHMASEWTEERWVRVVPRVWRMGRVDVAGARTSYEVLRDLLLDPQKSRTYLEPSVFYVAAGMYQVGIFLIQWNPKAGPHNITYHHIRPRSATHIVLWFANQHFEAVSWVIRECSLVCRTGEGGWISDCSCALEAFGPSHSVLEGKRERHPRKGGRTAVAGERERRREPKKANSNQNSNQNSN